VVFRTLIAAGCGAFLTVPAPAQTPQENQARQWAIEQRKAEDARNAAERERARQADAHRFDDIKEKERLRGEEQRRLSKENSLTPEQLQKREEEYRQKQEAAAGEQKHQQERYTVVRAWRDAFASTSTLPSQRNESDAYKDLHKYYTSADVEARYLIGLHLWELAVELSVQGQSDRSYPLAVEGSGLLWGVAMYDGIHQGAQVLLDIEKWAPTYDLQRATLQAITEIQQAMRLHGSDHFSRYLGVEPYDVPARGEQIRTLVRENRAKVLAAKELAAEELAYKAAVIARANKELAAEELAAKEVAAKALVAQMLTGNELVAKELIAKELVAKGLVAKEIAASVAMSMAKEVLAKRGEAYAKGDGVTQDFGEALKCFRAARYDQPSACIGLKHLYEQGQGVPKDPDMANMWLICAASFGRDWDRSPSITTADRDFIRKMPSRDIAVAFARMGAAFEKGEDGFPKVGARAYLFYTLAGQFTGSTEYDATRNRVLEKMDVFERLFVSDIVRKVTARWTANILEGWNENRAVNWWRAMARLGSFDSQWSLAGISENGTNGMPKDLVSAYAWYGIISELNFSWPLGNTVHFELEKEELAKAQFMVGDFFRSKHEMLTSNLAKVAVQWYVKAAENGNKEAQFRLGDAYAKGLGVDANPALAREWYLKSGLSKLD
jgi:TPR repeat protein